MIFYKYHGLGNDYIVMDPHEAGELPDAAQIRRICHRNYGIGSDGILWGPTKTGNESFGLRIFNPDGSEAEKSGNGLRIFARFLMDCRRITDHSFIISTIGGDVTARVTDDGQMVTVEMGTVSFNSRDIPVEGPDREVIHEKLDIEGTGLAFCGATIGNPHCVIIEDHLDAERVKTLGPKIENHRLFPNRTNVQFAKVVSKSRIDIEIWERGAGYTLASGSSASAAAAVACRLGHCGRNVSVHMPGGVLDITLGTGYEVLLSGPVTRIARGKLDPEMFAHRENQTAI